MSQQLETWLALLGAALVGGLGYLLKASRARAVISRDALDVQQTTSQGEWLKRLESRFAAEHELREASEARERLIFADLQDSKSRLREAIVEIRNLAAVIQRLERRIEKLVRMAPEDIRTWIVTEPAALDEIDVLKGPKK